MLPVRTLAALVALLVTGCSLAGDEPGGPKPARFDREQEIAQSSPAKLPDHGPQPGVLREAWRIRGYDTGIKPGTAQIRLVADQLFVGAGRGLTGYDPRTGAKRWSYRENARELSGYAVAGGRLITRSTAGGADPVLTGLDVDTGALRWEQQASPEWVAGSAPAWAGRIVADYDAGAGELVAVDAASGDKRWTRRLPLTSGCRLRGDPETDGSVLVVWEVCDERVPAAHIHAFDPADGKPLWRKEIGTGRPYVGVRRAATLIVVDRRSALIGRDGSGLADLSEVGHCGSAQCSLLAAGDYLLVGAKDRFWKISGGRTHQLGSTKRWVGSAAADDRLFGLRPDLADDGDRSLPPSALEVVDPVAGEVVRMPMPARLRRKDPMSDGGWLPEVPSWVGAGEGRLVVARGHDLVAYTSTPAHGPVELAGVPVTSWPDACRLLGAIRAKATRTERLDMSLRFGLVGLERRQCIVSHREGADLREASVLVEWVAPSSVEASALVDGRPLAGADEVQERSSGGTNFWVRVGKYVLRVTTDEPRYAPQVIAEVARQLR